MNIVKVKVALQNLIFTLIDAEKDYEEIYHGASNIIIKDWMKKYASERQEFHTQLVKESNKLGAYPEVRTSILGELNRVFIDFKLNNIDDSLPSIVDEIEKGSNTLIEDYDEVLDLDLSPDLRTILQTQKQMITEELKNLVFVKDELMAFA